jgi:hypothetical protein
MKKVLAVVVMVVVAGIVHAAPPVAVGVEPTPDGQGVAVVANVGAKAEAPKAPEMVPDQPKTEASWISRHPYLSTLIGAATAVSVDLIGAKQEWWNDPLKIITHDDPPTPTITTKTDVRTTTYTVSPTITGDGNQTTLNIIINGSGEQSGGSQSRTVK